MFGLQLIQERESEQLAPYAMRSAESRGRAFAESGHDYRSPFQRDRDRIIHSRAFRRLGYKTQVFVNHEGDYYRTRLTHTLEAAQIARTVARVLRLNEDLVEAIALSHDLGHPPFGHSGEEALHRLMEEHGGFEHNRQSLRVVDVLETKHPAHPGMNLSWEVREAIVKHSEGADIPDEFDPGTRALLEGQLVDLCDTIAYDNHDLDDGIKAGLIRLGDLEDVELWVWARERIESEWDGPIDRRTLALQVVRRLIDLQVTDLIQETLRRIDTHRIESVDDVRNHETRLVAFSPAMSGKKKELQAFLMKNVYRDWRVMRMAHKAHRFIDALFEEFVRYPNQMPREFQALAERDGRERAACDFIAGMTDRYAQIQYQSLFSPFVKTLGD